MNKAKGYVSVKLAWHQYQEIKRLLNLAGVKGIDTEKLHCTITYDKGLVDDIINPDLDPNRIYVGIVNGVKPLGKFNEETQTWNALVLTLDSPQLTEEHHRWIELGYDHSFPDYLPHLSVAYDVTEEQIKQLTPLLESLIGETYYFTDLSAQPIEE